MLPSSDQLSLRPWEGDSQPTVSAKARIEPTGSAQARASRGSIDIIDMLATESYTNPAAKLLRELNTQYIAQSESDLAMSEDYASAVASEARQSLKITPQLSMQSQRLSVYSSSEGQGSLQTTPESKSGYGSPEGYHGASDISLRKSVSSVTDTELFSDMEDGEEDLEDEPSGFEPTEVADLVPAASGALGIGDEPCDWTGDGAPRGASYAASSDQASDDEQYEPRTYSHFNRARTFSCESRPYELNSPTESQLRDEGFEFHNQLPEERHVGQFDNEAFRDALKEVTPELPRKQQWYAWRKVMEMLERDVVRHNDALDDSDIQNDYSLGSLADHSFGACQCGGDTSKCTCAPGQCGCAPHSQRPQSQTEQSRSQPEDEDQDVPMNIGYTPITPSFPPEIHHPRPSRASTVLRVNDESIRIPGLEPFEEDEALQLQQAPARSSDPNSLPSSAGCGCQCGSSCSCPSGDCPCARTDAHTHAAIMAKHGTTEFFEDLTKRPTAEYDPRETWSDAATAGFSPPPVDPREPQVRVDAFRHIATALSGASVFSPGDAPTPAAGFQSPVRSPQRDSASTVASISRPDTPRPVGNSYEYGIRQSVERELHSPLAYEHPTPAYENRSLSPSPNPYATPSDTEMHDATPTKRTQPYEREASVLPDAPQEETPSPTGSPGPEVVPSTILPILRTSNNIGYHIAPPPIPMSPTLKPRKQRATSGAPSPGKRNTKSGVYGSKIAKALPKPRNATARNVTSKVGAKGKREVTGVRVKHAVDVIENSVRQSVERERVVSGGRCEGLQKDGSPPRRSERVRARSGSPAP